MRRGGGGVLILIVLVAIAIGLFLMFGNTGGGGYAKQAAKTAKSGREVARQIVTQQMSILIAQYRQERGKLPAGPSDLETPGAFNDPWGLPMSFSFQTAPGGATSVTYRSAGPDGQPGNEDDMTKTDTLPF